MGHGNVWADNKTDERWAEFWLRSAALDYNIKNKSWDIPETLFNDMKYFKTKVIYLKLKEEKQWLKLTNLKEHGSIKKDNIEYVTFPSKNWEDAECPL